MKIIATVALVFAAIIVAMIYANMKNFSGDSICSDAKCETVDVGKFFNITIECPFEGYDISTEITGDAVEIKNTYQKETADIFGVTKKCVYEIYGKKVATTDITFYYCKPESCNSTTIRTEKFRIFSM